MNAILGMAELLSESQLTPEQARYVDVFRRAGGNLLMLINDILDLSKIESGSFQLETIPFDFRASVVLTLHLIPSIADATVSPSPPYSCDRPAAIIGDPMRLQQVLLNLLGNATKFTQEGAIDLYVRLQAPGSHAHIEFEIADSGIGIPVEKLQSIFEDFSQADASTTRQYGGTGLGLGIAKRLVGLIGGRIQVESVVGKGSTFRFTAAFEAAATPHVTSGDVGDLHGPRLLVIDDDATNRLVFRETLQAWGLEVFDFPNANEASVRLHEAKQNGKPFSLVLLDANMPDTDGFHAFEQLRAVDGAVPVIMLEL